MNVSLPIRQRLHAEFAAAVGRAFPDLKDLCFEVSKPREKAFGDFSTNVAMVAGKRLKANPTEVARKIAEGVEVPSALIASIDIVKPGFINIAVAPPTYLDKLREIAAHPADDDYGRSTVGEGEKIQVEFVSANPTGPLNVVSARAAAVGDALVKILDHVGYDAKSEFYINDGGTQVELLGQSLKARFHEALGERLDLPDGGYPGEYLADIAQRIKTLAGDADEASFDFARFAVTEIVAMQRNSLDCFGRRPDGGVRFDMWVRESSLKEDVGIVLDALVSDGRFVVEKEGAVWLKGAGQGEEDEWVIRRSTGQPTYFLTDITYHIDKRKRGFDRVIDIWGPDHHGHIGRMQTAMQVVSKVIPGLEIAEDWLRVLVAQQVNLVREGKRVQMSKRAGEYVTLDDILREIAPDPENPRTGADVARFFFLMRRCNSHLDFDLDLAKKMSDENPVYYVQYAHARISSIIEFAKENGFEEMPPGRADLSLLTSDEATELIKAVADFDDLIIGSAMALEPHRIPVYLIDLAGKFHRFYHNNRVVTDDRAMSEARLYLCYAVRTILRSALSLIGISAPTFM
ncbi:MAG: arginine--tRNA ligase [Candidatus Eisenbacteria bacterium]